MEEKSLAKQMQDDLTADIFESIGEEIFKKLGKFIAPAVKSLEKEMIGCRFQLQHDPHTGYLFFSVIKEDTILAFDLSEEPKTVVPIKDGTEFIEKMLKGELFKSEGQ